VTWPRAGHGYGRRAGTAGLALAAAGLALAAVGLALAGPAEERPASGAGDVIARLGPLTVTATALRPGPSGALTASVRLAVSGRRSDQLDAVLAAGGTAALYHEQVSLAEVPDLTGCGGHAVPRPVVERWLHYGPLPVPGQSGGPARPVDATLTVRPVTKDASPTLTVTFYFANGGVLPLTLPVHAPAG